MPRFFLVQKSRRAGAVAFVVSTVLVLPSFAQPAHNPCGPIANAYGPFDYRTQRGKLVIVEQHHFKPHVEALIRLPGLSGVSLGGDIDYTLRASPNHHRALVAMMQYGNRLKLPKVPGADYPVECYFDRAIRFAPDDPIVRMLFARYLIDQRRPEQAERQLDYVGRDVGDNSLTLFNLGLLYMELRRFDKALEYAHRAKALGSVRPELEEQLRTAGQWRDPDPTMLTAAAAARPNLATSAASPAPSASLPIEPGSSAPPRR
jgi:hypothetical protein